MSGAMGSDGLASMAGELSEMLQKVTTFMAAQQLAAAEAQAKKDEPKKTEGAEPKAKMEQPPRRETAEPKPKMAAKQREESKVEDPKPPKPPHAEGQSPKVQIRKVGVFRLDHGTLEIFARFLPDGDSIPRPLTAVKTEELRSSGVKTEEAKKPDGSAVPKTPPTPPPQTSNPYGLRAQPKQRPPVKKDDDPQEEFEEEEEEP